jgi:hypothetical protein
MLLKEPLERRRHQHGMSVLRKSLPRSILTTWIRRLVTQHLPAATESRLPPRPGRQQPYTVSGGALAVNAGAASGEWTPGQVGGFLADSSLTFAAAAINALSNSRARLICELETSRLQRNRRVWACQLPQPQCDTLPAPPCRPEALAKSEGGVLGLTGGLGDIFAPLAKG